MFSKIWTRKSTPDCSQPEQLKKALHEADAVIIGAGAGLSTSAGFTYAGERFRTYFSDFASKYGFTDILDTPGIRVDGSRVAANVITGISFLGAGVIFVRDVSIKGLTTAAGLWSMAGVGLAIGAGMYAIGIFSTALIMLIQVFARGKLRKLDGPVRDTFSITYENMPNGLEALKAQLKNRNIFIHHIEMEKNPDGTVKVTLDVSREHAITCTDLADIFAEDEKIKAFRL